MQVLLNYFGLCISYYSPYIEARIHDYIIIIIIVIHKILPLEWLFYSVKFVLRLL